MGLLSRIFGFKRSDSSADTKVSANYPDEYKQILKFRDSLNSILGKDRLIARSDYDGLVKEHSSLPEKRKTAHHNLTINPSSILSGRHILHLSYDMHIVQRLIADWL